MADDTMTVDGWENLTTGLGRATRDKRMGRRVKVPALNLTREHFDYLYTASDVAATIAELPAREMVREWITVNTDTVDGDREQVDERVNLAKQVLQKLDDLDAQDAVFSAKLWARVFGGALLFLGVDDGQDLAEPLDDTRIRTFDFVTVFDRWEVRISDWYSDPADGVKYGLPKQYTTQDSKSPSVVLMPQVIHESRFLRFDGARTSRRRMIENGGWCDSIFARLEELIGDYEEGWSGMFHLLQDFAQMVYKIKGLAKALTADEEGKVIDKLLQMDLCRSLVRGIPLDADNEQAERMATPVSGLPDLLDRASLRLAQGARMPVTLMMGQSPAGMNATGASDISFFYDQIKAAQESELRKPINRLIQLIFLSADGPSRGKEPENWSMTFNPLWQLDDKEESDIRKSQAETDAIYIEQGVLHPREVTQSRFGGDAYSVETVLDPELREVQAEMAGLPDELDDPAADPEPMAQTAAGGADNVVAKQALNGAQVQAIVQLAEKVAAGTLPRSSAIAIILAAFPVEASEADRMVPPEGSAPPPIQPQPAAASKAAREGD